MKARDEVAAAAFRSAVGAVDNAAAVDRPPASVKPTLGVGAADVDRRDLSGTEVMAIVRAEIADRTSAASEYEQLGRAEQATRLRAEAAVLRTFVDEWVDDS